MTAQQRLHETLAAVCPIATVRRTAGVTTFDPTPEATPAQIAAAEAALAAFDWSPEAHQAWEVAKAHPTAQASWDTPAELLFRAFALVVLDEINVLRAQHSLAARTIQQLKAATLNKIQAGAAD